MRCSLLTVTLAALASAAPLEDALNPEGRGVEKRAFRCVNLNLPVNDTFDDRKVLPAAPELTPLLYGTPNGTYLSYNDTAYANVGTLTNLKVPSAPNDIYVLPTPNRGRLIPTYRAANAFRLTSLRYVCLTRSFETVLTLPARCNFTVSCDVWGARGPATTAVSRNFTYTPDGLLSYSYATATFPAAFNVLSQCNVSVTSGSALGIVPPVISSPLTILGIDNVVNQGQFCHV